MPAIVLVRPRNPNNIGAAARAMANFGFSDLRVVAPHPPVWREARAAVGAEALLKRARCYENLAQALADRSEAWATSCLKNRSLRSLLAQDLPSFMPGGKSAVIFGPEKTGLTSEDLRFCHGIVRIPTLLSCPSMNLAGSVAIVCYQLAAGGDGGADGVGKKRDLKSGEELASGEQRERLLDLAEQVFARLGYRPDISASLRRVKAQTLLNRRGLAKEEAGFFFELARLVLRRASSL